jgi:hypothetical protein
MIKINIPGKDEILELEHLVLDFNGTLALDGKIKPGVGELLSELSRILVSNPYIHCCIEPNGMAGLQMPGCLCYDNQNLTARGCHGQGH